MKTKHSPEKDNPIISFCKATSQCPESALFFLEGFGWDLDDAVSGFLNGKLPPIKEPSQRFRSRSPSKRRYSNTFALKHKMDTDQNSRETARLTKDATHDDGIFRREEVMSMPDRPMNYEFQEQRLVRAVKQTTSGKTSLPFSDQLDSNSTS